MALSGRPATTLKALNVLQRVPADRFVATLDEARETAKRILTKGRHGKTPFAPQKSLPPEGTG